jgi:hypothetical protein
LLADGWWFSPDTPVSSTTKTGRHDIAEILLKVASNRKNLETNLCRFFFCWFVVFNATFKNISVISWQSVLLVEETGVSGKNH